MTTLFIIILGPILLLQGFWVRLTVPKLPEAPGQRDGCAGNGPPLRVLIAGDSAAAGVGAETQPDCDFLALSGSLDATHMAVDGFHPGPGVYALWGQSAAQRIIHRRGGSNADRQRKDKA